MNRISGAWVGMAAALVMACGADGIVAGDQSAEQGISQEQVAAQELSQALPVEGDVALPESVTDLHTFSVEGTAFVFSDVDGAVMLRFTAPLNAPAIALESLEGMHNFTLLEAFKALQPSAVPAPQLVAAHALEAFALGREDDAVHAAKWIQVVEKSGNTATLANSNFSSCEHAMTILGGITGIILSQEAIVTSANVAFPSVSNKKLKASGACNTSASTWVIRVDKKIGAANWATARAAWNLAAGFAAGYILSADPANNTQLRSLATTAGVGSIYLAYSTSQ